MSVARTRPRSAKPTGREREYRGGGRGVAGDNKAAPTMRKSAYAAEPGL